MIFDIKHHPIYIAGRYQPRRTKAIMKNIFKNIAISVAVILLLFIAFFIFSWGSVSSHPVSMKRIAKLCEGMSPPEVRKILGSPRSEAPLSNGGFVWTYGRQLQWYYFSVEFSASSNVVSFYEED
jgi:outer membrane protein assembly factor BamE (lipoprotein component of BamABCDE complex)